MATCMECHGTGRLQVFCCEHQTCKKEIECWECDGEGSHWEGPLDNKPISIRDLLPEVHAARGEIVFPELPV